MSKREPEILETTEALPETVEPLKLEKRRKKHSEMIRREAGIVFVTDPHGIAIPELRKDKRFRHVPLKVLSYWCLKDKWVERRQAVFEKWEKEVEARLGSEMAKARIAEIRELHKVRKLALDKLYNTVTPVKSWEGVVKVLLEVNTRLEELGQSVGKEMLPGTPSGTTAVEPNMRSDLSIEEVRAAAREVLKVRRNTIRAALPATTTEPVPTPIAETEPETEPVIELESEET
jgi:hypothetical protein